LAGGRPLSEIKSKLRRPTMPEPLDHELALEAQDVDQAVGGPPCLLVHIDKEHLAGADTRASDSTLGGR
jgi:hypothetical protein